MPICEAFANGVNHRWLSHRGSATATLKGRPADARRPVPQAAPPQHWHRARSEGTSAAPFDGGTGKVKERDTGRGVRDPGPRAGHSVAGPARAGGRCGPAHPSGGLTFPRAKGELSVWSPTGRDSARHGAPTSKGAFMTSERGLCAST